MYPNSRIRFRVACPRDFGKSYRMELDVAVAPDDAIYSCIARVNQWSADHQRQQFFPCPFAYPE